MEAKHTATPWKLEYIGKTVRVVTDEPGADYGDDVAVLPNTEQCVVDAEFIVRACNAHDDLVKALKSLLGYADAMHRAQAHEEGREIDYETFPDARAALAKAGAA